MCALDYPVNVYGGGMSTCVLRAGQCYWMWLCVLGCLCVYLLCDSLACVVAGFGWIMSDGCMVLFVWPLAIVFLSRIGCVAWSAWPDD